MPFFLTAFIVLATDQVSKAMAVAFLADHPVALIGTTFGLRLVRNPGGVFGLLPGSTLFFFLASLGIVVFVLRWGLVHRRWLVPLGMVLGGGVGNLIDRVLRSPAPFKGHVVDFIDLKFWPTFNLADTAIVLGVGLLIISGIRTGER